MDSHWLSHMAVWYLVFLFSTTMHEAMHSFVSARGGDPTAYQSGQATFNPLPHIQRSPFGMVVVPILSFIFNVYQFGSGFMIGWASAPFNPFWAARYPKRSFLMSLAGPLSHILPVILSFVFMYIGLRTGFFGPMNFDADMFPVSGSGSSVSWALALFLNVAFQLNILLLIFNLMPVPPLDGSEVWYLFMKKEEDRLRWRYTANSYSFIGLVIAWKYFPEVFHPVFGFLVRLLYSF